MNEICKLCWTAAKTAAISAAAMMAGRATAERYVMKKLSNK